MLNRVINHWTKLSTIRMLDSLARMVDSLVKWFMTLFSSVLLYLAVCPAPAASETNAHKLAAGATSLVAHSAKDCISNDN